MGKSGGLILAGLVFGLTVSASEKQTPRIYLQDTGSSVDPNKDSGLRQAIRVAKRQVARSERQEEEIREYRQQLLRCGGSFAEMSYAELKNYFSEPPEFISEKDRRGWKELARLAEAALQVKEYESRQGLVWQMREIAAAIRNNHRSPSPPHMDLFQPPLYYMDYAHNPIGKGEQSAYNIEDSTEVDLSRIDPRQSTFWIRPGSISQQDVFHGFGRTALPELGHRLWSYTGPKTSYGGCAGFEGQSGSTRIKVKFAETTSEPFTARIFWALGYHVEPTDYVHSLKLKYDRRFFREFHLRKDVQMKMRALFIPVYTVNLQQRYDPFDYVVEAVLKSGARLPGRELKERLLRTPKERRLYQEHPEDFPESFHPEFEAQIDYLITTPANVQVREEHTRSIGPWDFHSLDHGARREVRALGLVGAWVGWFDSRFENTRLKIVRHQKDTVELRHYLTDLGGGLGKAKGVLSRHCECPNDFGWRFTRPPKPQGNGKMTIPFKIVDYQPIEDTEAFRQMTYDDARWMARLIAQLTEDQIVQALVASGFDATEVRIYTEKLVSRRDWMIRDLGFAEEIAPLRAWPVDESFSFDPQHNTIPVTQLKDGSAVAPRVSELIVADGIVFPKGHTRTPLERARVSTESEGRVGAPPPTVSSASPTVGGGAPTLP